MLDTWAVAEFSNLNFDGKTQLRSSFSKAFAAGLAIEQLRLIVLWRGSWQLRKMKEGQGFTCIDYQYYNHCFVLLLRLIIIIKM